MELRDKLREEGVRPLIKHREFRPIDHAHQRADRWASLPTESDLRDRLLDHQTHARRRRACANVVGEFRELVLMCAVHNIKQSLKP